MYSSCRNYIISTYLKTVFFSFQFCLFLLGTVTPISASTTFPLPQGCPHSLPPSPSVCFPSVLYMWFWGPPSELVSCSSYDRVSRLNSSQHNFFFFFLFFFFFWKSRLRNQVYNLLTLQFYFLCGDWVGGLKPLQLVTVSQSRIREYTNMSTTVANDYWKFWEVAFS